MADKTPREKIELLRDFLRDSRHWIRSSEPVSRHRAAMQDIWEQALALSNGRPHDALSSCVEAVKSGRQDGEAEEQYHHRLNGIPSRAFGEPAPGPGEAPSVDKPQHFFAAARVAFGASLMSSSRRGDLFGKAMGKVKEAEDYLSDLSSDLAGEGGMRHGGYDHQDIVADGRGAEFGAALAAPILRTPTMPLPDLKVSRSSVPISNFLYSLEDPLKHRSRPVNPLIPEVIRRVWPLVLPVPMPFRTQATPAQSAAADLARRSSQQAAEMALHASQEATKRASEQSEVQAHEAILRAMNAATQNAARTALSAAQMDRDRMTRMQHEAMQSRQPLGPARQISPGAASLPIPDSGRRPLVIGTLQNPAVTYEITPDRPVKEIIHNPFLPGRRPGF